MKIIEFCGLPGSGKSTLCKTLIKRVNVGKVYAYKDFIKFVATDKRRKQYYTAVSLNPFRRKYLKLLKKFVSKYDDVSVQAVCVLIAFYDVISLIGVFDRKGVVILDEGFVQNITSIAHLSIIEDSEELTSLVEYITKKIDIVLVDCHVSYENVVNRLRGRNGKDRFNSIDDDEKLKEALAVKRHNIAVVAEKIPCKYELNLDGSTDEALQQLIEMFGFTDAK